MRREPNTYQAFFASIQCPWGAFHEALAMSCTKIAVTRRACSGFRYTLNISMVSQNQSGRSTPA